MRSGGELTNLAKQAGEDPADMKVAKAEIGHRATGTKNGAEGGRQEASDQRNRKGRPASVRTAKVGTTPRSGRNTAHGADHWTFERVIDREEERRAKGRHGKPLSAATLRKYRQQCASFTKFRGSSEIRTITPRQGQAWVDAMAEAGDPSNRTISQYAKKVRAMVAFARRESHNEIHAGGNPLSAVNRPRYTSARGKQSAFTELEAKRILKAARRSTRPHIRWMPWIIAYSGARVSEIAGLRGADFRQIGDMWFFDITDDSGRNLKTDASKRTVPVHPALIAEGLLEFLRESDGTALFAESSAALLRKWIREDLKLTRADLRPNHGWRHLFEDFGRLIGADAAMRVITGRADQGSVDLYGRSEALLPGLWDKMAQIKAINLD